MCTMKYPKRDSVSLSDTVDVSSLSELLFYPDLELDDDHPIQVSQKDGTIHLHSHSTTDHGICPYCNFVSLRQNGHETRHPQWMPINNTHTINHITLNRWFCDNPDCSQKTFSDRFDDVNPRSQRSLLVSIVIFTISIFCSASATEKIARAMGIHISHDSIDRMLDSIVITDDPDVEFVGVDDVALRKGQTYQTVVYDGKTHRLLALLDGRDGEALKAWLEKHPKINTVARDRAGAYAKAISEVLPYAMQVADRFHLFQNLLGYIKDILYAELPGTIYIKDGEIMDTSVKPIEYEPAFSPNSDIIKSLNYDNTPPVDDEGNEIEFINKGAARNSAQYKQQAESRKKKQEMIRKLQKDWANTERPKKKDFQQRYHISNPTLNRYLAMTPEQVDALDNPTVYKKRDTPVNEYLNIIYKMLADGKRPAMIYSYILNLGYEGSHESLRNHIEAIAFNNFGTVLSNHFWGKPRLHHEVIAIKKFEILKYITMNDKEKVQDSPVAMNFDVLKRKYPVIEVAQNIWDEFYEILMGDDPDQLEPFLETYQESDIKPFVNGIKKDIAPVKNAISTTISSGFVEGNNCLYKAIKRMMFGRASLDHLFRKTYVYSIISHTDAEIQEILFGDNSHRKV